MTRPPGIVEGRLAALRTVSRTLAQLADNDEKLHALLEQENPLRDRAGYEAVLRDALVADGIGAVRTEKRRQLAAIASSDVSGDASLEDVIAALSDLADASLTIALQHVGASDDMAVIGMGKLGGRELNYASDIDVMFVVEANALTSAKAAERLLQELGGMAPQGQAYRIDTNLRPEGRNGPLLRSLDGYVEYYQRWAKPWEFQALIKARPAAGNERIGRLLVEAVAPLVFPQTVGEERVSEIRKMKERLESHAARTARRSKTSDTNDVKLGPGGIRDIEFSVQLLQLVHGGTDLSVRDRSTLPALRALMQGGYIAEEDGAALQVAYRWLRNVEHRLQLWQERQVHHLPTQEAARARIARSLGYKDTPAASAASRFETAHTGVLSDTRARFDKLFYRPMISRRWAGGAHAASISSRDFSACQTVARPVLSFLAQRGLCAVARRRAVLLPALGRCLGAPHRPAGDLA
jgi:[glutamine synthetase] adenylyltransferase / [glutamine synthetase]-adenylyl-L-tyrosine phosphorylase